MHGHKESNKDCVCVFECDVCIHSGIHGGGTGNRDHMIDR